MAIPLIPAIAAGTAAMGNPRQAIQQHGWGAVNPFNRDSMFRAGARNIGDKVSEWDPTNPPGYTPFEQSTPQDQAAHMQALAQALGMQAPQDFRQQQTQNAMTMLGDREHQARVGSDQRFADRGIYRSGGAGAQQRGIGQAYDGMRQQAVTGIDQNFQNQQQAHQQMMMQAAMAAGQQRDQFGAQQHQMGFEYGPYGKWRAKQDVLGGTLDFLGNVLPAAIGG